MTLYRNQGLLPDDAIFEINPHAVSRLTTLLIQVAPESLAHITPRLFHRAPLLKSLWIEADRLPKEELYHTITTSLFGGDLSTLCELSLFCIRTDLPWRNMVNLTSFVLAYPPVEDISITRLLDFLESAPHLEEVELRCVSPPAGQNERVVSLACLKELVVYDDRPISLLVGHLLIPVGATLRTEVESDSWINDHLPRSLNNLRNISNFTQLRISAGASDWDIECVGPNGRVSLTSLQSLADPIRMVLEFLDRFDASTVEALKITGYDRLPHGLAYLLLLPMKSLRTLTISPCNTLCPFIHALNPDVNLERVLVCPTLEKLVLHTNGTEGRHIRDMKFARAFRGAKLGLVQIVDGASK